MRNGFRPCLRQGCELSTTLWPFLTHAMDVGALTRFLWDLEERAMLMVSVRYVSKPSLPHGRAPLPRYHWIHTKSLALRQRLWGILMLIKKSVGTGNPRTCVWHSFPYHPCPSRWRPSGYASWSSRPHLPVSDTVCVIALMKRKKTLTDNRIWLDRLQGVEVSGKCYLAWVSGRGETQAETFVLSPGVKSRWVSKGVVRFLQSSIISGGAVGAGRVEAEWAGAED